MIMSDLREDYEDMEVQLVVYTTLSDMLNKYNIKDSYRIDNIKYFISVLFDELFENKLNYIHTTTDTVIIFYLLKKHIDLIYIEFIKSDIKDKFELIITDILNDIIKVNLKYENYEMAHNIKKLLKKIKNNYYI